MVGISDSGDCRVRIECTIFYETLSKKDKTIGISEAGLDFPDVGSYVII